MKWVWDDVGQSFSAMAALLGGQVGVFPLKHQVRHSGLDGLPVGPRASGSPRARVCGQLLAGQLGRREDLGAA